MGRTNEQLSLPELRRALGKTQADVAAALEVGQDVVSRMERGPGLRLDNLRRYLAALGASCELQVRVPGRGTFAVREGNSSDSAEATKPVGRKRRGQS